MKTYTLEEARELLPRVIPLVKQIRDSFLELRVLQAAVTGHARGASGDGHLLADPWEKGGVNRIETLNDRLQQAAAVLDRWAIEVKDPEKGLIDFFHEREGRTVYLCYLLGEKDILFWHELNGGFAGRKPL